MKHCFLVMTATVLSLAANPISAHSQFSVQYERVFQSRSFSGTISVGSIKNNAPKANGVLVEDMSEGWKTVIASTVTDESGHFSFAPTSKGVHYLRLSAKGFRITRMKVRISKWARKRDLSLEITVAT